MIACLSNVRRFVSEYEKCFQGIETGAEPGEGFYLIGKKKIDSTIFIANWK